MLYLIANNSASVDVILTAWWIVLAMILLLKYMCDIEVAQLFLMLVSVIMTTMFGSEKKFLKTLSRFQTWAFLIFFSLWLTV